MQFMITQRALPSGAIDSGSAPYSVQDPSYTAGVVTPSVVTASASTHAVIPEPQLHANG